jgi:hypothetical protein
MNTLRERQIGSVHAVVIGILFVLLMAALGVVFYQNFIAQKDVIVERITPEAEKPLVKRLAFNSMIYGLEHPKEWINKADENTPNIAKITSPDGAIQVNLTVYEDGLGSVCDTNDGLKISSYKVDNSAVTSLAPTPAYLVETITDALGGGYYYKIGLTPDSGATHAAIGETHCNVEYAGIAVLPVYDSETLIEPMVLARIYFLKLQPKGDESIKDMKQIKDLMSTEDYATAVKILKSARKE